MLWDDELSLENLWSVFQSLDYASVSSRQCLHKLMDFQNHGPNDEVMQRASLAVEQQNDHFAPRPDNTSDRSR